MRKHGWQLPYHPLQVYICFPFSLPGLVAIKLLSSLGCLQVVAIAVFLALGFAFYVFFVPFVGKKLFQHMVMGLYTPLV